MGFISNVPRAGDLDANPEAEKRLLLAVSATNHQGVYYVDKNAFCWLRKRSPVRILGQSLFVYDLTQDSEARGQLDRLLKGSSRP